VPSNLPTIQMKSHRQKDFHDPQLHIPETEIDDPNDPEYISNGNENGGQKNFSGFVLNPYLSDGFFATSEDLDKNKRLRLLHLRSEEVAEFRGRKMIPLKEHQIQDAEFQSYGNY
jgi:hypothetical protein